MLLLLRLLVALFDASCTATTEFLAPFNLFSPRRSRFRLTWVENQEEDERSLIIHVCGGHIQHVTPNIQKAGGSCGVLIVVVGHVYAFSD